MKREESLVPRLSLVDVEANLIWGRDGRLTLVYELDAYHEPGLTDDEINQRAFAAEDAWNGLPEGCVYAFLVLADAVRGRAKVRETWRPIQVMDERTAVLEKYRTSRLSEVLRDARVGGQATLVLDRRHFFAATFRPKAFAPTWADSPALRLRQALGLAPRLTLAGDLRATHARVLSEVASFGRSLESGLWQMGLSFRRCDTADIVALLYGLLNPVASNSSSLGALPERPLWERTGPDEPPSTSPPYAADTSPLAALCDDDMEVGWDYLKVGGQYAAVISLKQLPDKVEPGVLAPLLALGRPRFVLAYRVEKPSQSEELAKLRLKAQIAAGLRWQNFFVDSDRKDQHADTIEKQSDMAVERIIAAGQKVFGVSLQIAVYDEDRGQLDEACAEVLGKMAAARGLRGYRESAGLLEAYLSLVPGAPAVNRQCRALTPVLVDLMPVFDCRPSEGLIPFRTARNTVTWFDPFDSAVNQNANVMVVATSGWGKSFLVATLLSSYEIACECKGLPPPCVYIVDCGGSYDRYLRVRPDGRSRAFSAEEPPGIDPFAWSEEDGPLSDQVSRLTWFLLDILQVSEADPERFMRVQGIVEQALTKIYGEGLPRDFSGLARALVEVGGDEARQLRGSLWSFVEGRLARLFRHDPTAVLDDSVRGVGFDFKGLQGKPDEAAIALRLVIFEIRRRTARLHRRRIRSLVVFDESWMLLGSETGQKGVVEAAGPFISEYVRTSRKDGGGVIGLSQSIADFQRCPWGNAIIGNSATKFLGAPGGEGEVRELREHVGLTERQIQQVLGLRKSGSWAEFLMIQGGGAMGRTEVVQVSADPLSLWTFGTSDRERRRMLDVAERHPHLSLLQQIELLAAEAS